VRSGETFIQVLEIGPDGASRVPGLSAHPSNSAAAPGASASPDTPAMLDGSRRPGKPEVLNGSRVSDAVPAPESGPARVPLPDPAAQTPPVHASRKKE